jgi:hypothetical protein
MRGGSRVLLGACVALAASAAHAGGSAFVSTAKGGRLTLVGDATASALAIRATEQPFGYVVEGLDGATIDGAASVTFSGVTRGLSVDLGGGDDALLLTARAPSGPVSDAVFLALSIRGGAGDDVVVFDHVRLLGKTSLDLGDGADTAAAFASALRAALRLRGGEGDDLAFVGLSSEVRAKTQLSLGLGDDVVLVENAIVEEKLRVVLDAGDDAAGFALLSAPVAGKIDGGLGDDLVLEDGSAGVGRPKGVEQVATVDDALVYELVEGIPGFEAAQDLANEFGVGLN